MPGCCDHQGFGQGGRLDRGPRSRPRPIRVRAPRAVAGRATRTALGGARRHARVRRRLRLHAPRRAPGPSRQGGRRGADRHPEPGVHPPPRGRGAVRRRLPEVRRRRPPACLPRPRPRPAGSGRRLRHADRAARLRRGGGAAGLAKLGISMGVSSRGVPRLPRRVHPPRARAGRPGRQPRARAGVRRDRGEVRVDATTARVLDPHDVDEQSDGSFLLRRPPRRGRRRPCASRGGPPRRPASPRSSEATSTGPARTESIGSPRSGS